MTSLTDRYVAATVRSLPESQRADVERELRASIEDDIDARREAGAPSDDAEREVLTELGDPSGLAARYSERPLFLIGPTNFLFYRRFVITLVSIVVPIAAVASALVHAIAGDAVGAIIAAAVVTALSATMHIAFWTTLVFAILDWTGASRSGPLVRWNVDMLPEAPERRAQRGDTIASIVFLCLVIAFLVGQQFVPIAWNEDGPVREPVLDPALWSFWLPYLIAIAIAEIVFTLVKHRNGGWTWPLAAINVVIAFAAAIPFAWLALSGNLYNPDFVAAFPWSGREDVLTVIGVISAVAALGAGAWDAIDGLVRAARSPSARRAS